jgi:hypothetical protein
VWLQRLRSARRAPPWHRLVVRRSWTRLLAKGRIGRRSSCLAGPNTRWIVADSSNPRCRPRQHLGLGQRGEQGPVVEVAHTPQDRDGAFAERHGGRVEVTGPQGVEEGDVVHGTQDTSRRSATAARFGQWRDAAVSPEAVSDWRISERQERRDHSAQTLQPASHRPTGACNTTQIIAYDTPSRLWAVSMERLAWWKVPVMRCSDSSP